MLIWRDVGVRMGLATDPNLIKHIWALCVHNTLLFLVSLCALVFVGVHWCALVVNWCALMCIGALVCIGVHWCSLVCTGCELVLTGVH